MALMYKVRSSTREDEILRGYSTAWGGAHAEFLHLDIGLMRHNALATNALKRTYERKEPVAAIWITWAKVASNSLVGSHGSHAAKCVAVGYRLICKVCKVLFISSLQFKNAANI